MAENEDGTEKTEQPSEKRLRESREKGDSPRSRELATAAVFAAAAIAMLTLGGTVAEATLDWMRAAMRVDPGLLDNDRALAAHVGELLLRLLLAVSPLILACLLACFVAPIVMGGLRFSSQALMPDFKRINPLSGLKRIYGREGVVELLKSLLRVALVTGAAILCLRVGVAELLGLVQLPLERAAQEGFAVLGWTLLAISGALALLAAVDVPYQHWSHRRKLMMTREELRQELKESEGSPEVKGRIRRLQQEMSQRRMMEAVPSADLVLINPTHYAVALRYDAGTMRAPRVVAKGVDEMALRIRETAAAHKVAIVAAPPLARALYRQTDIGHEIPVKLYSAVAAILSYVYQLRAWRPGAGVMPTLPELDVIDEPVIDASATDAAIPGGGR